MEAAETTLELLPAHVLTWIPGTEALHHHTAKDEADLQIQEAEGAAQSGPMSVAQLKAGHVHGLPCSLPFSSLGIRYSDSLCLELTLSMLSSIMIVQYVLTRLRLRGGATTWSSLWPSFLLHCCLKYALDFARMDSRAAPSSNTASPKCTGGTWGRDLGHARAKSKSEKYQI